MRIIRFGTYSLKIKSYLANEIGLNQEHAHMTFIIFQKVFHFWYLPIFPVEKFWKIKDIKNGNEITETTPKIRSAIDLKLMKQRAPLWSYSGTILIALPLFFLLLYGLYGSVNEIIGQSKNSITKNKRIDLKEEFVRNPKINDVYTFKTLDYDRVNDMNGHFVKYETSYYSAQYKVDYTVNYISRDSIGFEFLKEKKFRNYAYGLKHEFRLSKKDLIMAAKKFQDLDVFEYPNKPNAKTKSVIGVFQIDRAHKKGDK